MPTKAVRYTQPLLGVVPGSDALVAVNPGDIDSVLIRRDGVACTVYADNDKADLDNPVPLGVAADEAGVSDRGELLVYLAAGRGYDAVVTLVDDDETVETVVSLPDVSPDVSDVVGAAGGGGEAVVTIDNANSAATLDLAQGNVFVVNNPTASGTCTLTLTGATAGRSCGCTVIFRQRSSGDSGLALAGTVLRMNDGELPGPAQVANGVSVYSLLTVDGGTTVYAWKAGDSEVSAPPTAPDAPTAVVGTRGNAQVSVAFTPGASNGSAITGYTVTASPGGATATGSSSPIVVTGLTNGTAYTFTVHATNAIGPSPESSPSAAVTPATVPGAPTIGTATFGNTTATGNWSAPGSNGGSAITGYVVKLYRASDNVELASATPGNVTTHQFTGLTNGIGVYVKVAAINAIGTGSQSAASNTVTPATGPSVPGAPTIGTATAGNTAATANWTAPGSDGGGAITGYEVKTYDSSGTLIATDTVGVVLTFNKTGLTNGVAVKFKVSAINAVGTGPQSAFSNTVTPAAPGASDNFNRANGTGLGTSSGGQVWTEPAIHRFVITGNKAAARHDPGSIPPPSYGYIETGLSDFTYMVDVDLASSGECDVLFRVVDQDNCWRVLCLSGSMYLQIVTAGVPTNIGGFPGCPMSGLLTIKVVCSGSSVSTFIDSGGGFVAKHAVTDATYSTATKVGIGTSAVAIDNVTTYDNLLVVP